MSAKQAINDKIQGSEAAYLRCGGVVNNNQIKKGLLLSLRVRIFLISKYLAKLQAKTWLSRALSSCFCSVLARRAKCMRQPRSVKIWQNYGHDLWNRFLAHPVYIHSFIRINCSSKTRN